MVEKGATIIIKYGYIVTDLNILLACPASEITDYYC